MSTPIYGIEPYSIQIRKKCSRKTLENYINLTNDPNFNFVRIFETYLQNFQVVKTDKYYLNLISFNKDNQNNTYHIFFNYGTSGYGAVLRDSNGKFIFKRDKDMDECVPLYICLKIDNVNQHRAVILFQSFKDFSIKNLIIKNIHDLINNNGYSVDSNPLSTQNFMHDLINNGKVKKYRLYYYNNSDEFNNNVSPDPDAKIQKVVTYTQRGGFLKKLVSISDTLLGVSDSDQVIEVEEIDPEADRTVITVELNGKQYSITKNTDFNFKSILDILGDITLNNDNHPTPQSLISYGENLTTGLLSNWV